SDPSPRAIRLPGVPPPRQRAITGEIRQGPCVPSRMRLPRVSMGVRPMHRTLCALALAVAACAPPSGPTTPLVDPPPTPLPSADLMLFPGEAMEWDVYWQGLLVGHADLAVADASAHSHFTTTALARAFAKVRYDLVTSLIHGAPTAARERFELPGDRS